MTPLRRHYINRRAYRSRARPGKEDPMKSPKFFLITAISALPALIAGGTGPVPANAGGTAFSTAPSKA